jgi:hypothetical protein
MYAQATADGQGDRCKHASIGSAVILRYPQLQLTVWSLLHSPLSICDLKYKTQIENSKKLQISTSGSQTNAMPHCHAHTLQPLTTQQEAKQNLNYLSK